MNTSQNKNLKIGPNHKEMNELENLYVTSQFNSLENKVKEIINKYPENINLQNILGYSLRGQWKSKEDSCKHSTAFNIPYTFNHSASKAYEVIV